MAKMYKGFNKDMTCTPIYNVMFQYEERKTYTEETADLCNSGFHACEIPFDCLSYYRPAFSVYHEVDLVDVTDQKEEKDSKRVGKKITIGARLDIAGLIKAQIRIVKQFSHSATSGFGAYSATSRNSAHSATSGDRAHSVTSGNYANSMTSGYISHSATSGDGAHSMTSGTYSHSATSGDGAHSMTSGYQSHSATCGNQAYSVTTGVGAHSATSGSHSIAVALGRKSFVKAALGNWIVAAEYDVNHYPICVKSALVDGEKIKPNTWYKVRDGEFVEVEETK